jgi:K+-transporting ATPase KdpF subunit
VSSMENVVLCIIAAAVMAYLVFALIRPEQF